jgi:Spy/CpxP family protein refolding chaperone
VIDEEYIDKQSTVLKDSALSKDARRQEVRALARQKASAIEKVLTAEQKEKWIAARAERAKRHRSDVKKSRGDHALSMQKNLSLSDEQTSKIKAIDQEFASKFRALRQDSTLARDDSHEKAKSLREEYRSKTKAVLTDEQFQKWQSEKAARKRKKF